MVSAAAVEKAEAGDESMENRRAYMPFLYGRWDDTARAHVDVGVSERSRTVREGFRAEGAFSPAVTREGVGRLATPVLVYAGELDAAPTPETAAAGAPVPERHGDGSAGRPRTSHCSTSRPSSPL